MTTESTRCVLLDIDGTLVDSNDAHAAAWQKSLQAFGHAVDKAAIREWIGKGGDHLLPELTGVADDTEEGKAISKLRKEIFRDRYLPELRPFPDVRAFVSRCRTEGFLVGVASSAARDEVGLLLDIAGVRDLVELATSADDAERSKPSPDVVSVALQSLCVSPHEAVLVGDTPYDVEAGVRAGCPVIAVESGGWLAPDLRGAIAVYRDVADLLASWHASPLGAPRALADEAPSAR